jgi:hypothetical protein
VKQNFDSSVVLGKRRLMNVFILRKGFFFSLMLLKS